jgi:glycosyltransferase involved in cell wall biosynthesis
VVAVCRAAHDFFLKTTAIPHRKLTFIYNGIPLEKFLSLHPAPERPGFTFGTVGRLVPVKNHRSLLQAFSLVAHRMPGCRLEILGDGPLRQELETLSQHLGIAHLVLFHGSSLDVARFLSRLDAFVLCSDSEGLPLTLLEAMAAGLPVVATEVGGIPELVRDARCGWLCPVSDHGRLADAMLRVAESGERQEMGARGRASAIQSYSLEKMGAKYEHLFREILEMKGQAAS